ncbi:MAG: hypothetical protein ACT4OZ_00960 [Gemmatimonadota bacterium]
MTDEMAAEAKEVVRTTVEHEESLIDRRLSRLLTLQGFLFAAIAITAEQPASAFAPTLQWLIPTVGFLSAAVTFLGVIAAYRHIDYERKKLEGQPGGIFGSLRWPKWVGRANSALLALMLAAAWAVLLSI